jgi:uncharacterized membrane protein YbaN (DUF454 family)
MVKNSKIFKFILVLLGTISLCLGVLGIFLPLLPTTPFLLLSAALYFRGSTHFYNWLINHKVFGEYIRNFRENKAIPVRVKVISISLLWITILSSAYFFVPFVWLKILLIIIAVLVTRHILSFKNLNKKNKSH